MDNLIFRRRELAGTPEAFKATRDEKLSSELRSSPLAKYSVETGWMNLISMNAEILPRRKRIARLRSNMQKQYACRGK